MYQLECSNMLLILCKEYKLQEIGFWVLDGCFMG